MTDATPVALVTGGASGIGAAAARALADTGARVAVADRDGGGAAAVAGSLPDGRGFTVDLARPHEIAALVEDVLAWGGRIDTLVNAAGVAGAQGSILEASTEDWDEVMDIDLKAPFLLMQAVGRHMAARGGGGHIVNVGSSSAFRAAHVGAAYGAAKAALGQLTRSGAADLAPWDVNVNAIAPGLTATGMTAAIPDGELQAMVASGPLANLFGRVTQPEDVAAAIAFLCSPAARQITAQTIHVSAGAVV
jgi:NAD(P)-dependent dehydrogenase (short-subunit alcohol dehydrogenase family)